MSWKSLFLTTLVSVVAFIALVSMGMKYHWVNLYKKETKNTLQMVIPEQAAINSNDPNIIRDDQINNGPGFQAMLFENDSLGSVFSSMTKQQVIDFCKKEYLEVDLSNQQAALAVGDCVLSNYQETYQEQQSDHGSSLYASYANSQVNAKTVSMRETRKSPKKGRQAQTRFKGLREGSRKKCALVINRQTLLSAYEKQLLIDTCVADGF